MSRKSISGTTKRLNHGECSFSRIAMVTGKWATLAANDDLSNRFEPIGREKADSIGARNHSDDASLS